MWITVDMPFYCLLNNRLIMNTSMNVTELALSSLSANYLLSIQYFNVTNLKYFPNCISAKRTMIATHTGASQRVYISRDASVLPLIKNMPEIYVFDTKHTFMKILGIPSLSTFVNYYCSFNFGFWSFAHI